MTRRIIKDLDHGFCAMVAENVLTGSGSNSLSFLRRGQQSLQLLDRRVDRTSHSSQLQPFDDAVGIDLECHDWGPITPSLQKGIRKPFLIRGAEQCRRFGNDSFRFLRHHLAAKFDVRQSMELLDESLTVSRW